MADADSVRASEDALFDALPSGDRAGLDRVLAPDFLLIDMMTGSEIPGHVLKELVGSRQLVFESVDRIDSRVRPYEATAVVTGQTRMSGHYGEQRFAAHSRYTHVYVHGPDGWRLVTARGTPIAP
jgi:hypothetical protein